MFIDYTSQVLLLSDTNSPRMTSLCPMHPLYPFLSHVHYPTFSCVYDMFPWPTKLHNVVILSVCICTCNSTKCTFLLLMKGLCLSCPSIHALSAYSSSCRLINLIATTSAWSCGSCYHCLHYHCCHHCIGVHLQRSVVKMQLYTTDKHRHMHAHTQTHTCTHTHTDTHTHTHT